MLMLRQYIELQAFFKAQIEALSEPWSLLSFKTKPTREEYLHTFLPEDLKDVSFKQISPVYEKIQFPQCIFFTTLSGEEEVVLVDCEVSVINGCVVNQNIREIGSQPKLHQLFTAIRRSDEFEDAINPSGRSVLKHISKGIYVDFKEVLATNINIEQGVLILIIG